MEDTRCDRILLMDLPDGLFLARRVEFASYLAAHYLMLRWRLSLD